MRYLLAALIFAAYMLGWLSAPLSVALLFTLCLLRAHNRRTPGLLLRPGSSSRLNASPTTNPAATPTTGVTQRIAGYISSPGAPGTPGADEAIQRMRAQPSSYTALGSSFGMTAAGASGAPAGFAASVDGLAVTGWRQIGDSRVLKDQWQTSDGRWHNPEPPCIGCGDNAA